MPDVVRIHDHRGPQSLLHKLADLPRRVHRAIRNSTTLIRDVFRNECSTLPTIGIFVVSHVPHSFLKEGKVVVFAYDHHRPLDIPDRAVRRVR